MSGGDQANASSREGSSNSCNFASCRCIAGRTGKQGPKNRVAITQCLKKSLRSEERPFATVAYRQTSVKNLSSEVSQRPESSTAHGTGNEDEPSLVKFSLVFLALPVLTNTGSRGDSAVATSGL